MTEQGARKTAKSSSTPTPKGGRLACAISLVQQTHHTTSLLSKTRCTPKILPTSFMKSFNDPDIASEKTLLPLAYLMRGAEEIAGLPLAGLQVPLYAVNGDQAYWAHTDKFGNVDRFDRAPAMPTEQLVTVPSRYIQKIGDPRICAFIANPDKPEEVVLLRWQQMAKHVLTNCDSLLPIVRRRVAGHRLAKFMCEDVLGYVAANGLEKELGREKYPFEYSMFEQVRDLHLRDARSELPKEEQEGYRP